MMLRPVRFHFDNVCLKTPLLCGPYKVIQFGDLAAEAGFTCPSHIQTVHEISYIVSGKGVFSVNGIQYPVLAGDVILNRFGDDHEIVSDLKDPIRYFYLGFTFLPDSPEPAIPELIELFESSSCVKASGSGIRDLFVRLFGDYIANDSLTIPSMTAGIHQILITICRSCRHVHRQSYFTNETGKKRLFLDMVNYIDNNCRKMDALQSLSKQFGYSYSTLSELFTKMMGQTLKEYYTEQRFARAATCLTDGMRVTEVACYLGYRSIHSFSRAFSQHFSISPREYQKNPANAVIKKEK